MPVPRRSDVLALVLIVAFTALALAVGFRTGDRFVDVDERVYADTLVSMAQGEGYYPAMRAALVEKEGAPPTQVRSIRPPTLFLLLYRVPVDAWRWVVGIVFLATLVLSWRLGRPLAIFGGPIAVVLAGVWMIGAAPVLFLHSELWGIPFLLGGALALRDARWTLAALVLAAAVALRETYAIAFLAGLLVTERRRSWWPVLAVLIALAGVHAWQASEVLAERGREAPFGASGLSLRYILSAVSPGTGPLELLVGLVGGALGLVGLRSRWSQDRGARALLLFAAVMIPATIFVGRQYWCVTFGVAVACFAPAGVTRLASASSASRIRNEQRRVEAPR